MAGAGSDLYDWHALRPSLVRFLTRRTGCTAAAEDLAQDLWLKLQSSANVTPAIHNPLAYLFRAAANAAFDWRRQELGPTRERGKVEEGAQLAEEQPSPERQAIGRQTGALLEAAIGELPPKCREAFLLCRLEGLTMREAGKRMGVSERTIENHLAKATVHCRRRLIDAGVWP